MNTANHAEYKRQLRRQFRRARQTLPPRERAAAEQAVNRLLTRLLKRGRKIALYWPIGSELRLNHLLKLARERGACVYLPYIQPRRLRLWFTPYHPGQAAERPRRKRLNIPQFAGRKIRAEWLDVLLLPLVAADRQGYRLGQGGGYYDASLAHCRFGKPLKIGIGFACQLTDQLPHDPHDRPLDGFVCEHGYLPFNKSRR